MANAKFVKTAAAVALGASVVTTAVAPGAASAATSYKIKDGKLYKNGKIAKGYVVYKGTLYKNGKKNKGYAKVGTGSSMKLYYNTKLKKGFKTANNATLLFKDGVLYKGYKQAGSNERLYKDGKLTTGWIVYTNDEGTKYLYSKGYLYKGLKTATRSGVKNLFENGVLAEGTKEYKDELFTDGVIDTKEQVFQDTLYVDGKKAQGSKLFEDTLYVDGKLPTEELNKFGEGDEVKYYGKDGKLANGEFELDGKKVTIKDGVIADELVTAVEPATLNTVTVKFGKDVEKAEASNFAVANKATGEKVVVKEVKLAEDKKSATVVFYSNLVANTTYTVDTTIGEDKASNELAIGSLKASKVEVADKTVKADTATLVDYKVFDETGVDVTSLYPVSKVTFVSPATITNGQITLAKGTSTTVKVLVKDADKVIAESGEAKYTAQATEVAAISNWTVTKSATVDFDAENFKQNSVIANTDTDKTVKVQLKDQFGNEDTTTKATFESLNPSVAVVDKATGKISPLSNGTANIKISVADADGKVLVEKVVSITVQDASKASKVVVDKANVTVSTADTAQTVTATVTDQYGSAVAAQNVTAVIKDAKGEVVTEATIAPVQTTSEGKAILVLPELPAGTYTLEVTVAEGVVTTASVTVKAPGAFDKYAVQGLETTLDKYAGTTEVPTIQKMTPEVVSLDAEGLTIKKENTKVEVINPKDSKDQEIKVAEVNKDDKEVTLTSTAKAGDTFQVKVSTDGKVISTTTVKVTDTTPAINYNFSKYTLDVTTAQTVQEALQAVLLKDNKEVKDEAIFDYVTSDSSVVPATAGDNLKKGTATVYVKSVNGVKFETPIKLTVNVTDPAAPAK